MTQTRLLIVGIIGSVVAALCCFTPILALLLAAVGFSAATRYLDCVLLPAIVIFVGVTIYALVRSRAA
jgi:mercuric ion transport protein